MKQVLILIICGVFLLNGCGSAGDPLSDIYSSDILPGTANQYNIGSEELPYSEVWAGDATVETIRLTGQTVSRPPVIMDAGELLTVPQSGSIEYDGTGIYLTNTNHRRFISQAADSIIVPVTVTNTVVETTVFTGVLNADELRVHRVYRLSFFGELSTASAADTLTMKIKINGTTLVTLVSTPGVITDDPMRGLAVFTVRSVGAGGAISAYADVVVGNKEKHKNTSSIAVDTTVVNNMIVTFKWDVAAPGNIMTVDQAFLEVLD